MKLAGSMVLITGASGGIGGAIARQLVQRGASLILVNRQRDPLEALASELRAAGGDILTLVGDLAVPGQAASLVQAAIEQAGSIDILINCAGVQNFGFFAEESAADTAALFNVNTIADRKSVV